MIEMSVAELIVDEQTNTPVVVLREKQGIRSLLIWIGVVEATAIALELEKMSFPRPLTHDLIKNIMEQMNIKLERVEVSDLRENTYYALIYLRSGDATATIDARPSDAIALALRTNSPIFVAEKVLQKSASLEEKQSRLMNTDDKEKLAEILESLNPEDFGKYKM